MGEIERGYNYGEGVKERWLLLYQCYFFPWGVGVGGLKRRYICVGKVLDTSYKV